MESIKEKFIAFVKKHPWKSLGLFIPGHAIITTLVLGFPAVLLALGGGFIPSIVIGGISMYFSGREPEDEDEALSALNPKTVAAVWVITYFIVTGWAWYCFIRGIPWMR